MLSSPCISVRDSMLHVSGTRSPWRILGARCRGRTEGRRAVGRAGKAFGALLRRRALCRGALRALLGRGALGALSGLRFGGTRRLPVAASGLPAGSRRAPGGHPKRKRQGDERRAEHSGEVKRPLSHRLSPCRGSRESVFTATEAVASCRILTGRVAFCSRCADPFPDKRPHPERRPQSMAESARRRKRNDGICRGRSVFLPVALPQRTCGKGDWMMWRRRRAAAPSPAKSMKKGEGAHAHDSRGRLFHTFHTPCQRMRETGCGLSLSFTFHPGTDKKGGNRPRSARGGRVKPWGGAV